MFHAINCWLARQARRIHDARLAREHRIAQAVVDNGWQVQHAGFSTWLYRDPRFDRFPPVRIPSDLVSPVRLAAINRIQAALDDGAEATICDGKTGRWPR
jgi:hypothetical protein